MIFVIANNWEGQFWKEQNSYENIIIILTKLNNKKMSTVWIYGNKKRIICYKKSKLYYKEFKSANKIYLKIIKII